jgi:hypothetical protein
MVKTEQQYENLGHEALLRFRIARLDYALTQLTLHDEEEPILTEIPEAISYVNREVEDATPENMGAILEEINRAYETPNEG